MDLTSLNNETFSEIAKELEKLYKEPVIVRIFGNRELLVIVGDRNLEISSRGPLQVIQASTGEKISLIQEFCYEEIGDIVKFPDDNLKNKAANCILKILERKFK